MKANSTPINATLVLWTSLLLSPITGSSVDIFVPSLPFIASHFHAGNEITRLSITVYLITYGICQLFYGSLSDSFGRRKIAIIALTGYVISSLMIPFTNSIHHLLAWRGAQGVFAAGIGVIARAVIADVYSGKKLAHYASYVLIAWGVGPVLSPYLGGYLQHLFGWQANFYALAIYSFFAMLFFVFFFPETRKHQHAFNLHTILKNYSTILTSSTFIGGALICGLCYGVITLYNVIGPFLIEDTLKYGPIVYGRVALFLGIGWILGNLLARVTVARPSIQTTVNLVFAAFFIVSLLYFVFALFSFFNLWSTALPPIGLFICGGFIFTYCFGKCIGLFPEITASTSAALGSIFSLLAGVMSGIGSLLKSDSLFPLTLTYLLLFAMIFIIYLSLFKVKTKQQTLK